MTRKKKFLVLTLVAFFVVAPLGFFTHRVLLERVQLVLHIGTARSLALAICHFPSTFHDLSEGYLNDREIDQWIELSQAQVADLIPGMSVVTDIDLPKSIEHFTGSVCVFVRKSDSRSYIRFAYRESQKIIVEARFE